MRTHTSRRACTPDRSRLERYRATPELGPRILFFSGGTALRAASRALIRYTHNSIHLITPFDSGGSSAVLRRAFGMPAVGDVRNRLMALADQSVKGNPEIFTLFAHRLPKDLGAARLREEIEAMALGTHPLVRSIPDPMHAVIRTHFRRFLKAMPPDFDLRGASMGNLVLTAGYLSNQRQLDPVISVFSNLVRVCGMVRPTLNEDLHLAARLDDGRVVVGQHLLTGKEAGQLTSPIRDLWLTASLDNDEPVEAAMPERTEKRIAEADLICYPPGSFYSSILANLLPRGMGRAVAANPCPKVFVPNTAPDPETLDASVADQARILMDTLHKSGAPTPASTLDLVLIDSTIDYPNGIDRPALEQLGLQILDLPLATTESAPLTDATLLTETLLSLI